MIQYRPKELGNHRPMTLTLTGIAYLTSISKKYGPPTDINLHQTVGHFRNSWQFCLLTYPFMGFIAEDDYRMRIVVCRAHLANTHRFLWSFSFSSWVSWGASQVTSCRRREIDCLVFYCKLLWTAAMFSTELAFSRFLGVGWWLTERVDWR